MNKEELFKKFKNSVDKIPTIDWMNYKVSMDTLNTFCWRYIYPNTTSANTLAYMCRSKNTTGVFELFINKLIPFEIKNATVLHEVGHALLGHTLLFDTQREVGIEKIRSFWPSLKNYFSKNGKKINKLTDKQCEKIFRLLLNTAMDFEDNSKMFEEVEYSWARLYFNLAYISVVLQNDEEVGPIELDKINNFIDAIDSFNGNIDFDSEAFPEWVVPFCWAQDYEFPNRLSYTQYMDLMLMEPEKFFPKFKDDNEVGDKETETIDIEDIDNIIEKYEDTNSDLFGDESSSENTISVKGIYSRSGSGKDEYSETEFTELDPHMLEDFIYKSCFNKSIKDIKTDYLYNYNRNKFNSNILVSKQNRDELWRPGNVFLLVDCSGSINKVIINTVIKTIGNVGRKCGSKSRVIWWDTSCRGDYSLSSNNVPKKFGGGTDMADGIEYIKNNYLKFTNDKLIILSDFYDELYKWYYQIQSLKSDVIGVCWAVGEKGNNGRDYLSNRCDGYFYEDNDIIDRLLKIMPTSFIDINIKKS